MSAAHQKKALSKEDLSHKQIMTILIGLLLGMFLSALDQTIVSSSIYTIANDINGLSMQAWATTAYLLTSTISTPIYGKLSDIFGRRPLYIIGVSIFLAASIIAGFVTSMEQLALARALQGLGAGGLLSLGLAIIADIVPLKDRAKYQGYFMSVFGISSVVGPVIGGFFAGSESILGITGWRWVFLINAPLALITLIIVCIYLRVPHEKNHSKIDWQGAIALTVGLVPLLILAEQGREWGWSSSISIMFLIVGIIGVLAFIFAEHKAGSSALIQLSFFKIPAFSISTILNTLIGVSMFGAIAMIPLYLQLVKGLSPTEAGLFMFTFTFGILLSSIISGRVVSKTGIYHIFPVIGTVILFFTALSMGIFLHADTNLIIPGIMSTFFGLGLGCCLQPLTLAMQFSVTAKDIGAGTSAATFFRSMGGAIGTAVFLSLLFSNAVSKIASAFDAAKDSPGFLELLQNQEVIKDPNNTELIKLIQSEGATEISLDNTSWLKYANETLAHPIKEGFSNSINTVMLICSALLVLAFLVSLALPKHKIQDR